MIDTMIEHTETAFSLLFAEAEETPLGRRFNDFHLPDMYSYNCFRITHGRIGEFPRIFREEREEITVIPARSDEEYDMGKELDRESFGEELSDFASRRFERKLPLYRKQENGLFHLLATKGDEPVGNCDLFVRDGYAKLEDLDVPERLQGQGFGGTLLSRAARFAAERGAKHFFLQVDTENPALRLYRRAGLEERGSNLIINTDI